MTPLPLADERAVLALLDQAYDVPSDERHAFVLSRTDETPDVRARVLTLLATETVGDDGDRPGLQTGGALDALIPDAAPPDRVGPWRLTRLLGRGGMGAVYEAERDDGAFAQRVAVKTVRRRGTGHRLADRLKRETELLAGLSHPNIAQVLDGGEVIGADGQPIPYLVMEHVDGVPVQAALAAGKLGLAERLDLFGHVLGAAQYAHRNGVVHRDLSPGNVLVREDGVVKVIDFGIAASLADDDPSTARTEGFTAPERKAGAAGDTRADIYSLGRLLALVTDGLTVPRADDLAAIIARATADAPEDRYQSVAEFAGDLARYRAGEAVSVRRGLAYRLRRLLTRYPLASLAAAAALLALVGGLTATSLALAEARRAEAEATARFDEVRGLTRTVLTDVYDAIDGLPGGHEAQGLLIGIAHDYLGDLEADPRATNMLRTELAEAYLFLAWYTGDAVIDLYYDPEKARAYWREADERLTALPPTAPGDVRLAATRAWSDLWKGADLLLVDFDHAAALVRFEDGLRAVDAAQRPADPDLTRRRLSLLAARASALQALGRDEAALDAWRALSQGAVSAREILTNSRPYEEEAAGLRRTGILLADAGDLDAALAAFSDALGAVRAGRTADRVRRVNLLRQESNVYYARGFALSQAGGRDEAAIADYDRAIAAQRELAVLAPEPARIEEWITILASFKALPLARLGEGEAARAALAPTLASDAARYAEDPTRPIAIENLLYSTEQSRELNALLGEADAACAAATEIVRLASELDALGALSADARDVQEGGQVALADCD